MNSAVVNLLKKYDFSYFGTICAIFLIGILNLYSATHTNIPEDGFALYQIQIFYFTFALLVGFAVSFVHPKSFFRASYIVYGLNVFLLVLVLLIGDSGMGAQRWLAIGAMRIQPSELMKISLVMALGRWFTQKDPDKEIGLSALFVPSILAGVPAFLIYLQPDLGTALLIFLIAAIMVFYRRLKIKTILILGLLGLAFGGVLYKFGLKEYQRKRIITFLDPSADARGSGYNAIQSEIAIGSGQLFGKGFKKSSQASLNYLPENHTDFVFSVFNEEHGFFGSFVLISLYVILFMRILWLSSNVLKFYDSLLVIGLMAIFFCHTFINIGMVMGIMPIVGLPLPFMSYGGSSLLTFGICCGMVTSVSNTKNIF